MLAPRKEKLAVGLNSRFCTPFGRSPVRQYTDLAPTNRVRPKRVYRFRKERSALFFGGYEMSTNSSRTTQHRLIAVI